MILIDSIEKMNFFIKVLRESSSYIPVIFLNGSCYKFYLMLKKIAPDCELRINKSKTHVVTYFKGKCFDINGIVDGDDYIIPDNSDIKMIETWSFDENMFLKIGECSFCEEPIVV